jgi:long-subunit fatty acid transport protein
MLFPVVDQHWFSIGIGYKNEHYSVDASLAYVLGVSQKLTGAENVYSPGRYAANAVVPAVNLQYSF